MEKLVDLDGMEIEEDGEVHKVRMCSNGPSGEGIFANVEVGQKGQWSTIKFMVDTGAGITIINRSTYLKLIDQLPPLQLTNIKVQSYTGDPIKMLGVLHLVARIGDPYFGQKH